MNKVQLIGRTTKPLELRRTQSDKAVTTFTLAVDRRSKEEGADFIQCTAWGKTAEILTKYVGKGHRLGVSGHITTYNYENKEGKRVYVTEVTVEDFDFLQGKNENAGESNYQPSPASTYSDDDMPF